MEKQQGQKIILVVMIAAILIIVIRMIMQKAKENKLKAAVLDVVTKPYVYSAPLAGVPSGQIPTVVVNNSRA